MMRRLLCSAEGAMAIEVALIAPVLLSLSLGAFEASTMVARQNELQSAASDVETIALTSSSGIETKIWTIKSIIRNSLGLKSDQVYITLKYRCDADEDLVDYKLLCDSDALVSQYLKIDLTDTHTPIWTQFGIGHPVDLHVTRTIQVH